MFNVNLLGSHKGVYDTGNFFRLQNALSPNSDQHQISPHHISALDIGHENLTNDHQRSIVFMFKQVLPIRNK